MARTKGTGAGSIYRLKNGRWRAQLTAQDSKRISFTGSTKRECQDWVRQTRGQVDAGLTYDGTKTTVQQFLAGWLETVKVNLRPKTYIQYSQIARVHIVPKLGGMRLSELRPDHVQSLYDQSLRAGIGQRTVRLMHSVLHVSLVHALKLGVVTRNVCDACTPPKTKRHTVIPLSDDATNRLLDVIEGHRLKALIYLAILTGMREGELLGLKWGDLDWQSRRIKIVRQVQFISGSGLQFSEPKTDAGRRSVTIGEQMIDLLREQYESVRLMRLFAGARWKENDLMFPSTVGTPINVTNFQRAWREMRDAAALPEGTRFHDLRHLAVSTMLVKLHMSATEVAATVGHSRPSITTDIYGHLLPGNDATSAAAMESLIIPTRVEIPKK